MTKKLKVVDIVIEFYRRFKFQYFLFRVPVTIKPGIRNLYAFFKTFRAFRFKMVFLFRLYKIAPTLGKSPYHLHHLLNLGGFDRNTKSNSLQFFLKPTMCPLVDQIFTVMLHSDM